MTREEITKLLDEMDHVAGPLMQDAIAGVKASTSPESLAHEMDHVAELSSRKTALLFQAISAIHQRDAAQHTNVCDQLNEVPGALLAYCKSLGESFRESNSGMTLGGLNKGVRIPQAEETAAT